jgi:hypothetical protein
VGLSGRIEEDSKMKGEEQKRKEGKRRRRRRLFAVQEQTWCTTHKEKLGLFP